nr:MAG TPA: hypothetical protein [Caudoviricetes sp.]
MSIFSQLSILLIITLKVTAHYFINLMNTGCTVSWNLGYNQVPGYK